MTLKYNVHEKKILYILKVAAALFVPYLIWWIVIKSNKANAQHPLR